MRVFTGPIKGHELVGPWSPSDSFAAANGELLHRYVWSALDCPGGRARRQFISSEPAVTAYLAVQQKAPILAGAPHLVAGWPVRQDGRKSFVGMAIFDRDGILCASGRGALDHRSRLNRICGELTRPPSRFGGTLIVKVF